MAAEDFEQDYDDQRDIDFMHNLIGLGWALISFPIMFLILSVVFNVAAGFLGAGVLVCIYLGFMIIEIKFSNDSPGGLK